LVATVDGRLPPGPRGHPLLGSLPEIRRDNVLAFLDVWRRYGDTVRLRGPLTLYLVAHPDGVKHVLQDHAANYPRLRAEADEVLGGRPPGPADLPRLRYASMVVQEAMRLYPPIYLVLRRALADDRVGGYRIPAGADIALCPYVTHRHPAFWDNPEGFDPQRFDPELAGRRHRMAFFPFSGGPRRCIGEGYAQLQLPLVVAMVGQRYRLSLLPARPPEIGVAVTLRPRARMLMRVERAA
jgi:cytochrome P450